MIGLGILHPPDYMEQVFLEEIVKLNVNGETQGGGGSTASQIHVETLDSHPN